MVFQMDSVLSVSLRRNYPDQVQRVGAELLSAKSTPAGNINIENVL